MFSRWQMDGAIYGWIALVCGVLALVVGLWLAWHPWPAATALRSPLLARYLALAIHCTATIIIAIFALSKILHISINGPWLSFYHIKQLWIASAAAATAFYGSVHSFNRFQGIRWPGWQRILGCMIAGSGLVAFGVGIRLIV